MSANLYLNQYVIDFSTRVDLLLQSKGNKLRGRVMEQMHTGSKQASPVNQVGAVRGRTPTGRFAPIEFADATTARRWVFPNDRELAQRLDNFDKLRYKADYMGPYAQNAAIDFGRWFDNLIIDAALGSARTGELGAGTEAFDTANQVIAVDEGAAAATGLNIEKLILLKEKFRDNFVDIDTERPTLVITQRQESDLLRQVEYTSTEFTQKPVLVDGKLISFLGFDFVVIDRLAESDPEGKGIAVDANSYRRCFAFVKSGLHLGVWKDMASRVDERKDLSGIPWQIYACATAGATRLEQGKVIEVKCAEA